MITALRTTSLMVPMVITIIIRIPDHTKSALHMAGMALHMAGMAVRMAGTAVRMAGTAVRMAGTVRITDKIVEAIYRSDPNGAPLAVLTPYPAGYCG
ncbi:hypothetical protein [Ruegeria jejuensis]|uniref:hypothetical protein n=1 Tax=Ruegeria jejuensis TaxID=3233338 RepID=UPI00355AFA0F